MTAGRRGTWRAVGAVVAGFGAMMVAAPLITALVRQLWPIARAPDPPNWFLMIDLAYALGTMAVGGFVCALIARQGRPPLVLAGVVLALGLATAIGRLDPAHPGWYLWLTAVLGPLAVLLGAGARLHRAPALPAS